MDSSAKTSNFMRDLQLSLFRLLIVSDQIGKTYLAEAQEPFEDLSYILMTRASSMKDNEILDF